jgi:uncharacterized membrane protein
MPKVKPSILLFATALLALISFAAPIAAFAQTPVPTTAPTLNPNPSLTFYTNYPSQVYGIGESISISLNLETTAVTQIVTLAMKDIPTGWTATFQGGGQTIQSVYLVPYTLSTVSLQLTPPTDVKDGTYNFTATATGQTLSASLPLTITLQAKTPPKLVFNVDLPTITGSPTSTFSYNVTLQNQGQENLTVNLSADSGNLFTVTYSYNGQTVTSLPMNANDSKSLSVSASALGTIQGGSYPIKLLANGGSTQATLDLTAQVTGQVTLSITSPSGTLSGNINSGTTNAVKLEVQNTGSAPANRITLSASSPSGWTVTFDPATIAALAPNQQQEVTMNVKPSSDAVAGDYMMSITGTPADSAATTIQYRLTLLTSTLWGIVGVVIIAIAVGVVALAVTRFGRR